MRVPMSTDPQSASTVLEVVRPGARSPVVATGPPAWRAQSTTNSFAPTLVLERCGSAPSAT